jgi:hypothetical protein
MSVDAPLSASTVVQQPSDEVLLAEIPPAMRDYLHEVAKRDYERRLMRVYFFATLFGALLFIHPPAMSPVEANVAKVLLLVVFGYFAFGFALIWPERWERQLLKKQLDYRRQQGKWRWEK